MSISILLIRNDLSSPAFCTVTVGDVACPQFSLLFYHNDQVNLRRSNHVVEYQTNKGLHKVS